MTQPDLLAALTPVADVLDRLSVPYCVVGSVASSAHGIARASIDADVVADLEPQHIDALVDALVDGYYIDRDAVADAIGRRSMFNVVHLETMLKVDIYVLTARPFDRESFARRSAGALDPAAGRSYSVASAEDTVLHKLEWHRAGGDVSDRQWSDIVGVLRVQADRLDTDYLSRWAARLGVTDLLDKALREAGET
jgi:hypothetical protein